MDIPKAIEILGLSSTPTFAEVKKAYREQVKLWHPDRYSNGSAMKTMAEKNIQDANLAYALLKDHLPEISKNVSPGPSKVTCKRETRPISRQLPKLVDRGIQLLGILNQRFPKVRLHSLLEWLQHDSRNQYRPWYRYPSSTGDKQKRREHDSFDQVLHKAIRNQSPLKNHHRRRSSSRNAREEMVSPVNGVSKSAKTNRT